MTAGLQVGSLSLRANKNLENWRRKLQHSTTQILGENSNTDAPSHEGDDENDEVEPGLDVDAPESLILRLFKGKDHCNT